MIAITGASGHLGKATLQNLLRSTPPEQIIAVARNPEKLNEYRQAGIQIRRGDYNNKPSLLSAFEGVEKLLQISATALGDTGTRQEQNVVEAAVQAGVKHIVYTSSLKAKKDALFLPAKQALHTEREIKKRGLTFTFFRNSLYMELIPDLIGDVNQTKTITYPAKRGRVSFVSRRDIAGALSHVLTTAGHENKSYEITGPEAFDFHEIATLLSKKSEKPVVYTNHPLSNYLDELKSFHLTHEVIQLLISMAKAISAGEFSYCDNTLAELLGRKPLTLESYLGELQQ